MAMTTLMFWLTNQHVDRLALNVANTFKSETKIYGDSSVHSFEPGINIIERSHKDSIIIIPAAPIDTAEVIQRFFRTHFYSWTERDSNIAITLKDSIGRNQILWRDFEYKLLKPHTIINQTSTILAPQQRKLSFYAGGRMAVDSTRIKQLQPNFGVGWKDWRFDLGYDVLQKSPTIGVMKKL